MKKTWTLWTALALSTLAVSATPLQRSQVSADAKWVLHLDVDKFKAGKVGGHLINDLLNPRSKFWTDQLKREIGFTFDWGMIHSLTAYGSSYDRNDPNSVLLVNSDMDWAGGLEAAVLRAHPSLRVEKVETDPVTIYQVNEDSYMAVNSDGLLIVSRSRDAVQRAHEVLAGRRLALPQGSPLTRYPKTPFDFFFMAVAEDFGAQTKLPPNAAVLKKAEGGRFVVGEQSDKIHLSLEIRARSMDAAQQIHQVAQGLVALAALNADQKPELKDVAENTTVTRDERLVTVRLSVPVEKVLERMNRGR